MDFELYSLEPEIAYNENRELNLAWSIVEETGSNLFLTGKAGTGKTTFLKKLREKSAKNMVVLAPTGVAAINASGTTLHSFFQLPLSLYVPGKGFLTEQKNYLNVSKQKKRLISSLSLLVIDEVSMVRPDVLDAIDSILRRLRHSSKPFGGVQLLLIGDLMQLPPVVKDRDWEILKEHYASPYFFESLALKRAGYHTVELSVVYRQTDQRFIDILNKVRNGQVDSSTLTELNSRYLPTTFEIEDKGYIRLTTHNSRASILNNSRLDALPSPLVTYEAKIEGQFPESAYPVEQILCLKEGAQVMFVKNDIGEERRFYNGMIGKVVSLTPENVTVAPLDGQPPIDVPIMEWENTQYKVDESTGKIKQEQIGTFKQYPLQLAWAITIHKSQGLTFDKAIIDASHSFASGQTYVALSRCRSFEGLVLESQIPPHAIITDRELYNFVAYCDSNSPDINQLDSLKREYLSNLLEDLFDFEPIKRSFSDFHRAVIEYVVPIFPETEENADRVKKQLDEDICGVSRRFLSSCRAMNGTTLENELGKEDSKLAGRIKNGCQYFIDKLMGLYEFIDKVPRNLGNKAYVERLKRLIDDLVYPMSLKKLLLQQLAAEKFSIQSYLDAKSKAAVEIEKAMPLYSQPRLDTYKNRNKKGQSSGDGKQKEQKEKKSNGYSISETLNLFRQGKSVAEIAQIKGVREYTIENHLAELVRSKRLKEEDLAPKEVWDAIKKVIKENSGLSYVELIDKVKTDLIDMEIPRYIIRISLYLYR